MAKRSKTKAGLTRDGSADDGRLRFRARLIGRDPVTKKIIVDTERLIEVNDLAEAQAERKRLTEEAVQLKLGKDMGGGKLRFQDAAVERWPKTITRHSTKTCWTSYMRRVSKDFGQRWLHSIRQDEWQRWLDRQIGAKPTIDGIRMALVNLYDWAIAKQHAHVNPVEGTKVKRKRHTSDVAAKLAEIEKPKKRALTSEELRIYLDVHREKFPMTYPLLYTMLALGTRYSEVSVIKRSDVDWRTGIVTIRRAHTRGRRGPPKGDEARLAALATTCLELLRGHVAESAESEWLFPRPAVWFGRAGMIPVWSYSTMYLHIKASMKEAGVYTDNATHFARHTIKGLLDGELPDSILRKVIGHSDEKVHAKYGDAQVIKFAKAVEREIGGDAPKKKKRDR